MWTGYRNSLELETWRGYNHGQGDMEGESEYFIFDRLVLVHTCTDLATIRHYPVYPLVRVVRSEFEWFSCLSDLGGVKSVKTSQSWEVSYMRGCGLLLFDNLIFITNVSLLTTGTDPIEKPARQRHLFLPATRFTA